MWNKHFSFQSELKCLPAVIGSPSDTIYKACSFCDTLYCWPFLFIMLSQLVCGRKLNDHYSFQERRLQANCLNLWAREKLLLALGKELLDFFSSAEHALSNCFSVRKANRNGPINVLHILKTLLWPCCNQKEHAILESLGHSQLKLM